MSDSTIVTSEKHLYQTIVQFDKTIVLPRKPATGNIHDYLFCYCPLVGILFEVLRILNNYSPHRTSRMFLRVPLECLKNFSARPIAWSCCSIDMHIWGKITQNISTALLWNFKIVSPPPGSSKICHGTVPPPPPTTMPQSETERCYSTPLPSLCPSLRHMSFYPPSPQHYYVSALDIDITLPVTTMPQPERKMSLYPNHYHSEHCLSLR